MMLYWFRLFFCFRAGYEQVPTGVLDYEDIVSLQRCLVARERKLTKTRIGRMTAWAELASRMSKAYYNIVF